MAETGREWGKWMEGGRMRSGRMEREGRRRWRVGEGMAREGGRGKGR